MDIQNYHKTHLITQKEHITYEPIYPTPNSQENPPQMYQNNSQHNQFNQNPQYQSQNYNIIYQEQITQNTQYISVPQESLNTPFEGNILEIPFEKTIKKYCFFIFMFISIILNFLPVTLLIEYIISPFFLIIEFVIFLYFENNKIVIMKDESENKIYIQLLNYLFIKRKEIILNIYYINFKVIYFNKKYLFLILNNCNNGKEIDLNSSTIRNTPLQFLYFFDNIDINKFNGQYHLNSILNNFSRNQENPLNFNINAYMNKQQDDCNQNCFTKYIKINEHFFTYYNNRPFNNNYNECLFKGTSITIRIILLCGVFSSLMPGNHIAYFIITIDCIFFYVISILIGLCICKCRNSKKCLRIDMIYSLNFDKLFIGISINNKKRYITTSELFINEIDRFILNKNEINEKGFHLNVILKENIGRELCYIEDQQEELEGLIYILNEKIIDKIISNNKNVEQQCLSEYSSPMATPGN